MKSLFLFVIFLTSNLFLQANEAQEKDSGWTSTPKLQKETKTLEAYEARLREIYHRKILEKIFTSEDSLEEKKLKKEKKIWLKTTLSQCGSEKNKEDCLEKALLERQKEIQSRIDKEDNPHFSRSNYTKSRIFEKLYPEGNFYSGETGWQCLSDYLSKETRYETEKIKNFEAKELDMYLSRIILVLRMTRCGRSGKAFLSIWDKDQYEPILIDEIPIPNEEEVSYNKFLLSFNIFQSTYAYLDPTEFSFKAEDRSFGYRIRFGDYGTGASSVTEFLRLYRLEDDKLKEIFSEPFAQEFHGICMVGNCDNYQTVLMLGKLRADNSYPWVLKTNVTPYEGEKKTFHETFLWNGKKFTRESTKRKYDKRS